MDIGPVCILGTRLTTTMTVLPLLDGGLLLYSPLPLTAERRAAVEALGPAAHLHAPSRYQIFAMASGPLFYTRLIGFYDRVALSRAIRWLAFSDRSAARRGAALINS